MQFSVAPVGAAVARLGEGPLWDDRSALLWWVDILGGVVHSVAPASGDVGRIELGTEVGAVGLRAGGGLVAAVRDGFVLVERDGTMRSLADVESNRPGSRMNDGAVDAAGRFWASTMAFDARPGAGTLYRLDPSGAVTPMLAGLTIGNGIDWSPGGDTMYFADSGECRIDRIEFDVNGGQLGERRVFVQHDGAGTPDGLCVDAEGCVWTAVWGGSELRRYDPAGQLMTTVPLPVSQPSSCAFGGSGLTVLYVTSAQVDLEPAALATEPLAGRLLCLVPGVSGRAANRFAG